MKKVKTIALNLILLAMAIITIIPFLWMLVSSFAPNSEIVKIGGSFWPSEFTLNNYVGIQEKFNFMRMFGNSLFISIVITLITIYTSVLLGFVFAKFKFKGNNFLFSLVLSTMMIPWAVTIIPKYEMMMDFGWLDTYTSLIIPSMVSAFGVFMFRQSISQISDEMLEAARVDGASDWFIFHRIIIPMSRNTISSLAIFQFLWSWEDFLWPYLMINDQAKQLLPVGLRIFNGQYGTDYGGLFAATSVAIIPVLIIYLVFQKQFIAGIQSGSGK
ncbi:carbohydrate ABC transporter permease [Bacillus sp. FJAT-49711]|uniref:carbohydrate ABC transporter permease n=1 Tax=Bacillus sp. FJAT-49711 TaxID=2833585 RepID=UPI001BC97E81|nr:carbohydrate ABC transporter permease [Bacillus sp. FJAT-49711]MBS4218521.1 carbohydrate ABC transporter permease [Bacillus sp. FJAT-49711]